MTSTRPCSPEGRTRQYTRVAGSRCAIVYAGALLLGYLHTPEVGAGLLLALGVFACGSLVAGSIALLRAARYRSSTGGNVGGRITLAVLLILAAGAIASKLT